MSGLETRPPLNELIWEIRNAMTLTQELFAQRLGVTTRTIARWEEGDSTPRSRAHKVALALAAEATADPSLGRDVAAALGIGIAVASGPGGALIAAMEAVGDELAAHFNRSADQNQRMAVALRSAIDRAQRLLAQLEWNQRRIE